MPKNPAQLLLVPALAILFASAAHASEPYFPFEQGSANMLSPELQTWQTQFEDNGDYGESWFYVVQTDDGGALFAMLSITNLGLRTYSGVVSVQWYPPEGEPRSFHKEVRRDEVSASESTMDIRVGPGRTWGGGRRYRMTIDDPDIKLDLDCRNVLPGRQFGGGKVEFYEDRRAEWAIAFNSPRATTSGSIEIGGRSWDLAGNGYHDHGWSTIKMPTFISRWYTVRLFHEQYTIIAHRIHLQEAFGGGTIDLGILGREGRIVGTSRNLRYRPTSWRPDRNSGYRVPSEVDFSMRTGGYGVSGELTEARFLESIDVLGQVSWPVRTMIKAFYTKPYMLRFLSDYELEIATPEGETESISGQVIMEANYY